MSRGGPLVGASAGDRSAEERSAGIVWLTVDDGLWVAEPAGEFAGMIVKRGEGSFERTDRIGRPVGLFATLGEAEQSP